MQQKDVSGSDVIEHEPAQQAESSGSSQGCTVVGGASYEARLLEFIDLDDLPIRDSEFRDRVEIAFTESTPLVIVTKTHPRLSEFSREDRRVRSLKGAMQRNLNRWITKNELDGRVLTKVTHRKIPEGDYPTKIRIYGYVIPKTTVTIQVPQARDAWWDKAKRRMNEKALKRMGGGES